MLILTQDKKNLEYLENSAGIYVNENEIIMDFFENIDLLGTYKDEQRAKEVLLQIYNWYDTGERVFKMPEE